MPKISGGVIEGLVRQQAARDKPGMKPAQFFLWPLIDFALPPRCAGCGEIVGADLQLCGACWQSLEFLTGDGCALCGTPEVVDGLICAPCLAQPPRHDGVRAGVVYGDLARRIVLRMKHGRRTGLAHLMARIMARHIPAEAALLVPVPLHRWRIWSRGFNQSALLARHLSRLSGQPAALDVLQRVRATPLLRGLGAKARAEAVRGVFAVNPRLRDTIKGKTVLLIDDVYTSGATAGGCAAALKRAGAAKVILICWARVLIND
jgi:ComF family protein